MRAAVKLEVTIPNDRRIQLPDSLPDGRAEIIVLYPETTSGTRVPRAPKAASASVKGSSYFTRLIARQPVPLSEQASRALDEADRGER